MVCEVKSCATSRCSIPPDPEGSNGRHTVLCDTGKLDLFLYCPVLTGRKMWQPAPLALRWMRKKTEKSRFHSFPFTLYVYHCQSRAVQDGRPDSRVRANLGSLWKKYQTNVVARRPRTAVSGAISFSSREPSFLVAEAESELVSL